MLKRGNKLENPLEMYPSDNFPMQKQEAPGLHHKMQPVADSGEKTYVGTGRLEGRKAFITGGDSGIGRAVAIAYAREGAEVAINYLPEEEPDAESLEKLLKKEGRVIHKFPGDLYDERTCIKMIEKVAGKLGSIDILVLNAAVQVAQEDIANLTAEQIQHTFNVNVFMPMYLAKASIPYLPAGASIIFTGSAEYYTPNKLLLDYAASKFAIVGFSLALAKQVMGKGIRVNTVCPGPVWTPLEVSGGNPDEMIPEHGQDTPMKRPGQPVELAGVYVFLASKEASYVTAEVYGVTGGLSAGA